MDAKTIIGATMLFGYLGYIIVMRTIEQGAGRTAIQLGAAVAIWFATYVVLAWPVWACFVAAAGLALLLDHFITPYWVRAE